MKLFVKIVVLFVLVFSSIAICLSNDEGCRGEGNESQVSGPHFAGQLEAGPVTQDPEDCQADDCICLLSCHNVLNAFSAMTLPAPSAYDLFLLFNLEQPNYPAVHLPLEKPPII